MAKKARTGTGNRYKTAVGWGDTQSKIDSNELHQIKKAKVTFDGKLLKYKPTRGANKIIQGHIPSSSRATTAPIALRIIDDESTRRVMGNRQILPRKLLDNGQGKLSLGMDISDSSSIDKYPPAPPTTTTTTTEHDAYELLHPPNRINSNRGNNKDTAKEKQGSTQREATATTGHNSVDQTLWRNDPTTGALGTAGKNLGGQRNGTARTRPAAQGGTAIKGLGKLQVPNMNGPRLDPK